jgi:hypothetical protein
MDSSSCFASTPPMLLLPPMLVRMPTGLGRPPASRIQGAGQWPLTSSAGGGGSRAGAARFPCSSPLRHCTCRRWATHSSALLHRSPPRRELHSRYGPELAMEPALAPPTSLDAVAEPAVDVVDVPTPAMAGACCGTHATQKLDLELAVEPMPAPR